MCMRINELPIELLDYTLSFLSAPELALAARVCKLWRSISFRLFKRHYNSLPFVPIDTENWSKSYSERTKIHINIRKNRFHALNLNDLPQHQILPWIEKVKKDTVLPITGFGDYFSYAELNTIRINNLEYLVLDSTLDGTLAFASPFVLYYFTDKNHAVYAPSKCHFKATFKAIILSSWDFILPVLDANGDIQIFRFYKSAWTHLFKSDKSPHFRILHDADRLIVQHEKSIDLFSLNPGAAPYTIRFEEAIRFIKAQHGVLHVFSGLTRWEAYDLRTNALIIDTDYRVKNGRFLTERKFTQIVTRKTIAYKANKSDIIQVELPPFAKIIKAIWAEKMIFFVYSHEELFYVESFDVIKKERIKFPKLVFHLPINIFYENGYLLCHSRLFETAFLFNFRFGL